MSSNQNPILCTCFYDVLKIKKPSMSMQEVDRDILMRNYRNAIRSIHPDKNSSELSTAAAAFINRAMCIIRDKDSENEYRLFGQLNQDFKHDCNEGQILIQFIEQALMVDSTLFGDEEAIPFERWNSNQSASFADLGSSATSSYHQSDDPLWTDSPNLGQYSDSDAYSYRQPQGTPTQFHFSPPFSTLQDSARSDGSSLVHLFRDSSLYKNRKIEVILDHELRNRKVWFKVKWLNYSVITREPTSEVVNDLSKLREYMSLLKSKSSRRFSSLLRRDPLIWSALQDVNFLL